MLGSGEHSGTIALLSGITLVVFCGIGISLVADKRLNFGNSRISISKVIESDREKLRKLQSAIEQYEERWQRDHAPAKDHDLLATELKQMLASHKSAITELSTRKVELAKGLEQSSKAHVAYRRTYSVQARADSVGEKYDSLTLTDGRTYRSLVIRGFDASGIRIHHQGGSARIRFSDLPASWIERYQWTSAENKVTKRKPSPKPPLKEPVGVEKEESAKPPRLSARDHQNEQQAAKLERLRNHYRMARESYLEARDQASHARRNASNSNKSVPGSLETWAERAVRLEQYSQRLQRTFYMARSELSKVSPGDPLLKQPTR